MLRPCALAATLVLTAPCLAVDTLKSPGIVDRVTVYRGQAQVTRTVEIPGPTGLHEVLVGELPDRIIPQSLYAEIIAGGEVRSVRYRERPVEEDVREEVRNLDQEIQSALDQIESVTQRVKLIAEHKVYLGNLEQFSAASANTDLQKGALDGDTLKGLTLFLLEQRRAVLDEDLQLRVQERELREKLSALQRQRQTLTAGSAKSHREAVVLVNVADPAGTKLLVHYLVNDANWQPSYNVRVNDDEQILVEYQASVRQMSGEDWGDVAMTLSTATPSLVAKAPDLATLSLRLTSEQIQRFAGAGGPPEEQERFRQQLSMQRSQLADARNAIYGKGERRDEDDMDRKLNELASEMQFFDIVRQDRVSKSGGRTNPATEGFSVSYELPSRTSLPSRNDQQLLQIARLPMKAEFFRTASPVLTSYVYREANAVNNSTLVLLAGPASTYVTGQFVGHGHIPNVTAGESFSVGLGIDPALRAAHELIERRETTQGGNRSVEFTYRLTVENFGEEAEVRVYDRMPLGKEHEIKVTFLESNVDRLLGTGDSKKKDGILRWDLAVPAGASGVAARSIEYSYRLEYDKTMSITGGLAMADGNP